MHTCHCYQIHHCNTALPPLLPSFLLLEDPSAHSPIQQQQLRPTPLLAWQLFFSLLSSPAALPWQCQQRGKITWHHQTYVIFHMCFCLRQHHASRPYQCGPWACSILWSLGTGAIPNIPDLCIPPSTCHTGDMQLLNKFLLCHLHTILHARWRDKICNRAQQSSRESNHSPWKHFYQLSHVPRTEDVWMMKLEEGAQSRGQKNRLYGCTKTPSPIVMLITDANSGKLVIPYKVNNTTIGRQRQASIEIKRGSGKHHQL